MNQGAWTSTTFDTPWPSVDVHFFRMVEVDAMDTLVSLVGDLAAAVCDLERELEATR